MELSEQIDGVHALLRVINEREATILRMRFGLDGHEPLTLKEIGEKIGLTRERVRQLEIEALRKLSQRMEGGVLPRKRTQKKPALADN